MKKTFTLLSVFACYLFGVIALNNNDSSLQISGSADVYFKYDFSESAFNSKPYSTDYAMGTKENAIDFGMLNLKINKQFKKASITADLAFGPRANDQAINNAVFAYYIQNLYFTYQAKKELSISAGVMYRYETYEKLAAVDNFNYFMSNAYIEQRKVPARSVGIKAKYVFSDKINLSVGLFNSIDMTAAQPNPADYIVNPNAQGLSDISAQLVVTPIKDLELSAAIWHEGQKNKGNHLNFQTRYTLPSGLRLGLDINNYTGSDTATEIANSYNNFTSEAIYIQKPFNNGFTLGARFEHEQREENTSSNLAAYVTPAPILGFKKESYNIITLTGVEKLGSLSFKQELKYDITDNGNVYSPYIEKNPITVGGQQTSVKSNKSVQFVLAAVYSF